jgi:oxygen-independent coproporphyrinogen-3 oxidase
MSEFMILGLRLTKGINTKDFTKRFGQEVMDIYGKQIHRFLDEKLLEEADAEEPAGSKMIRLSERGLDLANHVMQSFI